MSAAVLELERASVGYGRRPVLSDLTLTVPRGSVTVLLGRNGAGKSSLVKCVLGQLRLQSGRVSVLGADPWRRRARLMRRVGVVPETPDAPPAMTGSELERFCRRLYATWDERGYVRRLERFGVPLGLAFSSLSKGQRAQVMLALALAHEPELMVLDDPTLGLDPVALGELYEQLVDELANRGLTLLVATHDLGHVEAIATDVALIDGGRLVLAEPLEALKERHRAIQLFHPADTAARELIARQAPLRVDEHDWGIESYVGGFDAELAAELPSSARVAPMSLEAIFNVIAGDNPE